LVGGVSVADSNFGETEADCVTDSGQWEPYNCEVAEFALSSYPEGEIKDALREAWQPECCEDMGALCQGTTFLNSGATAGYSCSDGGDSNFGGTEGDCTGTWTSYNCATAALYFEGLDEYMNEFRSAWAPKCCSEDKPSSPTWNPTAVPTFNPTTKPSEAPTKAPTVPPIDSNGCVNDTSFRFRAKSHKSCDWFDSQNWSWFRKIKWCNKRANKDPSDPTKVYEYCKKSCNDIGELKACIF